MPKTTLADFIAVKQLLKEVANYFESQPVLTPDDESLLERINSVLNAE